MIKHYLDIFTGEEIDKIINLGDSLVFEKSQIGVGDKPKVRQSEISWIHPPSMAQWMINKIVKELKPSFTATIIGINKTPKAGDILIVCDSEKIAKEMASKRYEFEYNKKMSATTKITLEDLGIC